MKKKFSDWLGELLPILFACIFLPVVYIAAAIAYIAYNVPELQDSNQIELMVEQVRYTIPSVLILAGFMVIPTNLFEFVVRFTKKDKQQAAIEELQKTVQTLQTTAKGVENKLQTVEAKLETVVEQNQMLLKKLEENFVERGSNRLTDTIMGDDASYAEVSVSKDTH